jgi:hypothetical protein
MNAAANQKELAAIWRGIAMEDRLILNDTKNELKEKLPA